MELGSEFNLDLSSLAIRSDPVTDYLSAYPHLLFFDSGRSALKHLAGSLSLGDGVLMPEFICDSVYNCFDASSLSFYRLREDFSVDLESLEAQLTDKTRVLFLMHYFGSLQPDSVLKKLRELADRHGLVIVEDTTHSIFSRSCTVGDYMISSIRKWMPLSQAGVLYYREDKLGLAPADYPKSRDDRRVGAMVLKDLFLSGTLDCNSTYREIFAACESRLDAQREILRISDLSAFLASCVSISELIRVRKRNYRQLDAALDGLGVRAAVPLREDECPLVYPIRVPARDSLRSYLMENRIYCAVHWPFDSLYAERRLFARACGEELISLPIDQRYGQREIEYLADVLKRYGGALSF